MRRRLLVRRGLGSGEWQYVTRSGEPMAWRTAAVMLTVLAGCFVGWAGADEARPNAAAPAAAAGTIADLPPAATPVPGQPRQPVPSQSEAPEEGMADRTAGDAEALQRAKELVEKLGDPQFAVRENAAAELAAMGLAARGALLAGMKHSDPQVRRSSRWLIDRVAEEDLKRRLAAFEAGEADPRRLNLPCWRLFADAVGDEAESRRLFVAMLRAEGPMLETIESDPESAADVLTQRVQALVQRMGSVRMRIVNGVPVAQTDESFKLSEGALAAVLFAASEPSLKWGEHYQSQVWIQSLLQNGLVQGLLRHERSTLLKRLAGRWMLAPVSIYAVQQKLSTAVLLNMREGVDLAVSTIETGAQPLGQHMMPMLISAVGLLGGKEYSPVLARLLENETVLFRGPNDRQTQVRDVALAWLIALTEQEFTDYGWEQAGRQFKQLIKSRQLYVNHAEFAFANDEARQAALKRWRDYAAAHPLPPEPKLAKVEINRNPPGQAVRQAPKTEEGAAPSLSGMKLQLADRLLVQALSTARELCREGRFAEGVRILDDVLSAEEDYAYQPIVRMPLFRCLKAEAETLLAQLPPQGREAYRLQFGAAARMALGQAMVEGGIEALAAVAERYFFTEAGAEAAFLLADSLLDRGQAFRAALYYQRLRTLSPDADRFEPALSLRLTAAYLQAGLSEAAESAARRLAAQREPGAAEGRPWMVAGQPRERFARAGEMLRWLDETSGRLSRDVVSGWLMHRGDPTRNRTVDIDAPCLDSEPLLPMLSNPTLQQHVAATRKRLYEEYQPAVSRLSPLVVGKLIVFRGATHLHAVDFTTGKLVWEAGLEDSFRRFLRAEGDAEAALSSPTVARGLQRRFFDDQVFGALSSDGRLVFGVEDIPFGFGMEHQVLTIGPDGRRRIDSESSRRGNLLTAHDLSTGKLCWEIGGASGSGLPLAGTRFLGPPLPLGDRLYACAVIGRQRALVELDAASGNPRTVLSLSLVDPSESEEVNPAVGVVVIGGVVQNQTNAPSTAAAMPSYADGVLVCQIGDNQYVAVNLATQSVRWVYHLSEAETGRTTNIWIRRAQAAQTSAARGRWIEAGATIDDGRVLLTPVQLDELICLDLSDGRFLWSAPRRDGLYVGGVDGGRVLVVGRTAVWAIDLDSGRPAWPHERLTLPASAMPSGLGLAAEGKYHLPLSNGDVLTIDMAQGKVAARARGSAESPPGNLVAAHDAIIAQTPEGLWRFETLAGRDRRLAEQLAAQPDDPLLLRQRGEILLARGRVAEAVELLQRSARLKPAAETHRLLVEAVGEGLRTDFDRFRPLAEQIEPLLGTAADKTQLLRQWAAGLQSAQRWRPAFETYLRLIDAMENTQVLDREDAGCSVQRGRWVTARLVELWQTAPEAERNELDSLVARRLEEADPAAVAKLLPYLRWHPAVRPALLAQAAARSADGQSGPRPDDELALVDIVRHADAAQRREALRLLTLRNAAIGRGLPAAAYVQEIIGELGDRPVFGEQSAAQFLASLPPDSPLAVAWRQREPWPAVKPKVEAIAAKPSDMNNMIRPRFIVQLDDGAAVRPLMCEADVNRRTLTAYDQQGRIWWQLTGLDGIDWNLMANYQMRFTHGTQRGNILVVWLGNKVIGIDLGSQSPKSLWQHEAMKSLNPNMLAMQLMMRQRMNQPGPVLPQDALPLVFNSAGVFFAQDNHLLAVDPASGEILWRRIDLPQQPLLFGSSRALLVVGAEQSEAMVVDPWDGRELGRRAVPKSSLWLATEGERIVVWDTVGGKRELSLFDPLTQTVVWRHEFDEKAVAVPVADDEAAVVDPQGRLTIVAIDSGQKRLEAALSEAAGLNTLLVQRASDAYYVTAGREISGGNRIVFNGVFNPRLSGYSAAIGRSDGKLRWLVELQEEGIGADLFPDTPVMVFYGQNQEIARNMVVFRSRLMCLDRRTGRLLFETPDSTSQHQIARMEIVPDLEKRTLEVRTANASARFDYSESPAEPAGKP